jgi:hypothetical protein
MNAKIMLWEGKRKVSFKQSMIEANGSLESRYRIGISRILSQGEDRIE